MRPSKQNKAKRTYIEHTIEHVLQQSKAHTPTQIEAALLEHALTITIPRKAFIEREGKMPPKNFVLYPIYSPPLISLDAGRHPGRTDHATVACFVVQKEYSITA